MSNNIRVLAAAAILAVSAFAGVAQAQTFSDGSTSPGGLVTESNGALDRFASRGGAFAPFADANRNFGHAYAYMPASHRHGTRHRTHNR
jgi:hypothetical protein